MKMRVGTAFIVLALCIGASVTSAMRPINIGRHLLQDETASPAPDATITVATESPAVVEVTTSPSPAATTEEPTAASPSPEATTTPESPAVAAVSPAVEASPAATVPAASPAAATPAGAAQTTFTSIPEALAYFDYLSTLRAAVEASGIAAGVTPETAYTILAPSNSAFEERLAKLGLTPAQALEPANRELLTRILQLHIIPAGAFTAEQLTDGQVINTALDGATLTVDKTTLPGRVLLKSVDTSAEVIVPDVRAGASVIHVINDVLLPAGVRPSPAAAPAAAATPAVTTPASPAAVESPAPVVTPITTNATESPAPSVAASPNATTAVEESPAPTLLPTTTVNAGGETVSTGPEASETNATSPAIAVAASPSPVVVSTSPLPAGSPDATVEESPAP